MNYHELETIWKDTIKINGNTVESIVCMEECAELQKVISKFLRNKGNKDNLIEEIADVKICIELLKEMYDISSCDIDKIIIEKTKRQAKRNAEIS
jgi:NTP pyrophosphatase (non-canonical NTP hydrolase)